MRLFFVDRSNFAHILRFFAECGLQIKALDFSDSAFVEKEMTTKIARCLSLCTGVQRVCIDPVLFKHDEDSQLFRFFHVRCYNRLMLKIVLRSDESLSYFKDKALVFSKSVSSLIVYCKMDAKELDLQCLSSFTEMNMLVLYGKNQTRVKFCDLSKQNLYVV